MVGMQGVMSGRKWRSDWPAAANCSSVFVASALVDGRAKTPLQSAAGFLVYHLQLLLVVSKS